MTRLLIALALLVPALVSGCDGGSSAEAAPTAYLDLAFAGQDRDLDIRVAAYPESCDLAQTAYPFPPQAISATTTSDRRERFSVALSAPEPGVLQCLAVAVGANWIGPVDPDTLGRWQPDTVVVRGQPIEFRLAPPFERIEVEVDFR